MSFIVGPNRCSCGGEYGNHAKNCPNRPKPKPRDKKAAEIRELQRQVKELQFVVNQYCGTTLGRVKKTLKARTKQ